jgi:uncharacterized protein YjbI with pentapeptide repeats
MNIDFIVANFEGASFLNANKLQNVIFVEANAQGMNFIKTNLETSDFSRCQCSKIKFFKTRLLDVSFNHAKLDYANFSNSFIMNGVNFHGINGTGADFSKIDVT